MTTRSTRLPTLEDSRSQIHTLHMMKTTGGLTIDVSRKLILTAYA